MWHGDRAWLKDRLAGLEHSLHGVARYENGRGLLEDALGWNYLDWVAEWQAAVLNVRLEQEKADTITEPKRVFMPDQPFFADPYFAKLTGKTV